MLCYNKSNKNIFSSEITILRLKIEIILMEEEEVDMEDSHMALIQEIISIKEVSSPVIKNISSSHPVSV